MVRRSHGRCKVCRAITHIDSRFGLCAVHMRQRNKRIEQERQDIKRRRRLKVLTNPVLEEDHAMPDTDKILRPRVKLTDEQQVQILDAYTQTDEDVQTICDRFGIKGTYIYNVLDRVGVSWRRANPESFAEWQANQQPIPNETEKALENMLKLPNSSGAPSPFPNQQSRPNSDYQATTVLPAKPEPVAPTPAVERRTRPLSMQRWAVEVEGTLYIEAPDIEEAIRLVKLQSSLRIASINPA